MKELSVLDMNNMKFVKNIIYFDGPLLSHMKYNDTDYLRYWVDIFNDFEHWIIFKININDLNRFLKKEITLLDMMSKEKNVYSFDTNDHENFYNFKKDVLSNIDDNYLPTDKSFYF